MGMTNSKRLFHELQEKIVLEAENLDEIKAVLHLVFEKEFGLTATDILAEKTILNIDTEKLNKIIERLNRHEPIQYILEEAYFFGRKFNVNDSVLIPRPETEMVVSTAKKMASHAARILDIGTGSGCIAISLKLEIPTAHVYARDVSENALAVAKENALRLNAHVNFIQSDILNEMPSIAKLDLIVSNPPYITESEKKAMQKNVLDFEPALALFVPDHDPLSFYKAIVKKGYPLLNSKGKIIVEINERFGKEVARVFAENGYEEIKIIEDLNGKDRIVCATKP